MKMCGWYGIWATTLGLVSIASYTSQTIQITRLSAFFDVHATVTLNRMVRIPILSKEAEVHCSLPAKPCEMPCDA